MTALVKRSRIAIAIAAALSLLLLRAGPASAAIAPANDDFDHATVVTTTPFSVTEDTTAATTAPDDPATCGPTTNSVWFAFTAPVTETVVVNTGGNSSYFAGVGVFTGSRGALSEVVCGSGGPFSPPVWLAMAGVTYHIMVAAFGSGGTLGLSLTVAPRPANDDVNHATAITSLPYSASLDTTGATSTADDPSSCGGTKNSVWYSFKAPVNETVFVNTNGGANGVASAYTGARGSLNQVACGDNFNPAEWVAKAGVTYRIMIVTSGSFFGPVDLVVTAALPPTNDDFNHSTAVGALPFTTSEATSGATAAPDDPTSCGSSKNSVWFAFTPSVTETFLADARTSNYTAGISVYTGSRGSLNQVVCAGGFPPAAPTAKWAGTAGVTYRIMVADASNFGVSMNDQLTLTVTGKLPPANDDFDHATVVPSLPFTDTIDASGATSAADDPTSCLGGTDSSVWYDVTASIDELIVADSNASIGVFAGSRGSLQQVACGSFFQAASWHAVAGVKYHVMLANTPFFGPAGLFTLHLQGVLPPANDDITHATVITRLPFTDNIDTTAATSAPGDPSCVASSSSTVWYRFTAPATGIVALDGNGSNYPATVSAYTGTPGSLTQVACGLPSTNLFGVQKGTTYYFMVGSAFGIGGALQFHVTVRPDVPANGPCTTFLTGKIVNSVSVGSGVTCIGNASVGGGITVSPGGQLLMIHATVNGSVTSDGAEALAICDSTIGGQVMVRKSTGLVLIGDGGDGTGPCKGNKIGGTILVGGSVTDGNTSGVEVGGNTVSASVTVSGNTPDPATVLSPEDAGIEIEANHIGAGLSCNQNGVMPVNDGLVNTVTGIRAGQCAGL